MDEIKRISQDELKEIIAVQGFDPDLILKDYNITLILYLIKDVEGVYFKGGTALQKIFLNHSRISEDIDFTLTKDLKETIKEITLILGKSKLFQNVTKAKDVDKFTRLVATYKTFSDQEGEVFIDLNSRATLLAKPEKNEIKHFYKGHIPQFSINTLAKEEMIAEKIESAIARNKPRDHYDIYMIIKQKIPINLQMVKKKCEQANVKFDLVSIFNNAKKLKNKWDDDMVPLLAQEISFEEVMKTLARHFNLKEKKKKKK